MPLWIAECIAIIQLETYAALWKPCWIEIRKDGACLMQNKNLYVTLHIAILLAINRTTCTMTIKERLSGLH